MEKFKPRFATVGQMKNHSTSQKFRLKSKPSDFEPHFFPVILFAVSQGLYCRDCTRRSVHKLSTYDLNLLCKKDKMGMKVILPGTCCSLKSKMVKHKRVYYI